MLISLYIECRPKAVFFLSLDRCNSVALIWDYISRKAGDMISQRVAAILEKMRAAGFRRSAAREAILLSLELAGKPVSVAVLLERASLAGKAFNKTTVYRELESLKRSGYVKELTLRNDVALYELVGEHHHHLTCVSCGDVRDIRLEGSLCGEEQRIAKKEGFRILDHSFEFFGLCGKCS